MRHRNLHIIRDVLTELCRRQHLRLLLQRDVFIIHELREDARARRTGADACALDLCPQLLILDEVAGVFHREDHRSGSVAFRRRGLALLHAERLELQLLPLPELQQRLAQTSVVALIFALSTVLRANASVRRHRHCTVRSRCRRSLGGSHRRGGTCIGRIRCRGRATEGRTPAYVGDLQIALFLQGTGAHTEALALAVDRQRDALVDRRWEEDREEATADELVHLLRKRLQRLVLALTLTGRDDRVVVGDLLVVDVAGLCDGPETAGRQDLLRLRGHRRVVCDAADVLLDLLRHGGREHTRIGTRVGGQLLLVELLRDGEGLIRANLEHLRAVVLQLRKIIEERRILRFLLLRDSGHGRLTRKRHEAFHELGGTLRLQEALAVVDIRRAIARRLLRRLPVRTQLRALPEGEITEDAVKGRLLEGPNLLLALDDHAEDAGHDTADGHGHLLLRLHAELLLDPVAVLERQRAAEVDAHEVVLLRPAERRRGQVVILTVEFRLADAAEDLLVRLGIDPDTTALLLLRHLRHHIDEPIDVLSLAGTIGADIDGFDVRTVQLLRHHGELLRRPLTDLIFPFIRLRDERERVEAPLLELLIVRRRIAELHKVTHAPGHHIIFIFQEAVAAPDVLHAERLRELLRYRRLLCDK